MNTLIEKMRGNEFMQKKIILIHSLNDGTALSFGDYVLSSGKCMGYNVIYPKFPKGEKANYNSWSTVLEKYSLNRDTIIIAHSLGATFIIKYLAEHNIKIKLFISVAGTFGPSDDNRVNEAMKRFIVGCDEITKFIEITDYRYSIYSDNDPISSLTQVRSFANLIEAEHILIKNAGHFGPKSNLKEIPILFKIIKSL